MTRTGNFQSPLFLKKFTHILGFFLWITVFVALTVGTASATDIQVTASVDKQELTLEDSVYFSVEVEGTQSSPPPELPPLDSFKVRPLGSSSSIQIINGERTSSTTFNFVLIPKETGTFTINPAAVKIEGRKYQAEPITLVVKQPSKMTRAPKEAFAELVISNKRPYVQEQVTATLRIYHRVEIRNLVTGISFKGFREQALKNPAQHTRIVDGIRYLSYEVPTVLFPLKPGKVEIPVGTIEFDQVDRSRGDKPMDPFDPFGQGSIFSNFGRLQHKVLRTNAVTLDVQPLPQSNQPENFSNLVGDFTISAQLSRTEIEVGDTTTLTVSVSGQGNINDLASPSPQWGNQFKVYEDQTEYNQTSGEQTVSGEKIYTYALVPLKPGKLQIPSISLSYFDPTKGEYISIQTQALALKALPGKIPSELKVTEPGSGMPGRTGNSIQDVGEDILPIHTGPEIFENQGFAKWSWLMYGIGLLLPAGLFLIYSRFHKRQQRLKYDIAFSRSHGAYNLALNKLHTLSLDKDSREISRKLSLIVREYLGNVLNLQGTAITSTEVEDKLAQGRFSEEEILATRELLEKHEALQYAPTKETLPENSIEEVRSLLDRLEKK